MLYLDTVLGSVLIFSLSGQDLKGVHMLLNNLKLFIAVLLPF